MFLTNVIIPGQSDTYRHLRPRVTDILAETGQSGPMTVADDNTIARIHTIPVKKHPKPQVTFLAYRETQALLDAITTDTWTGRRDQALFTLAVQTGLRLSEITGLSLSSVHLRSRQLLLGCE